MEEKLTNGTIFRVKKDENFTVMGNYHLNDRNLSLKAKGLMSLILSLPPNWNYSKRGLISICKENETAVTNALNELKQCGYLIINKLKNEKSQFHYVYTILENPKLQNPAPENLPLENLPLENLCLENHVQLNTNIINTKKLNTNKINPGGYVEQGNTTKSLEKNTTKTNSKISTPGHASKPTITAFSRLGNSVKAKLIDLQVDEHAKKSLENYCLAMQDDYAFKDSTLCNRIDEIFRKARGVSSVISVICNYNINGNYKNLFFPSEKQIKNEVHDYFAHKHNETPTEQQPTEQYVDEEEW